MPSCVTPRTNFCAFLVPNRTQEKIVGILMIKCPATGRGVSTGIEVLSTERLPVVTAPMLCPACGRVHHWTKNDAWLAAGGEQYREPAPRKWRVASGQ
jgi:hypothetical protein